MRYGRHIGVVGYLVKTKRCELDNSVCMHISDQAHHPIFFCSHEQVSFAFGL